MTRRVVFWAAIFSVAAILPVSAVSASVEEPSPLSSSTDIGKPVARYFPVQETGPGGFFSPNDVIPWGLDRIDQRQMVGDDRYEYNQSGAGVKVYVADTGVQADHPDLVGRVVPGWSYRSDAQALSDYSNYGLPTCGDTYKFQIDGTEYERQFLPATHFDRRLGAYTIDVDDGRSDNELHGTHVASTIAGALTGVAKDVTIIPLRVLDSCGQGTPLMISKALQWILDQHAPGEKAIVNLSLGFTGRVAAIDELITEMIDSGILVVAAAGNYDPYLPNQPTPDSCNISPAGSDPRVITVGASAWDDSEAVFSFRGNCVDLFAPGQLIIGAWNYAKVSTSSTSSTSSFLGISGTSMAAPHVSGALARYLQGVQTMATGSAVSTNAMAWLKTHATCNAISYFNPSASNPPNTINRLLAVDAPVIAPCSPISPTAVASQESATVSWTEPVAFNGEVPSYIATASPGGRSCSTTQLSCTITGLAGDTQHTISVTAINSTGSSSPVTVLVTPGAAPQMNNLILTPGDASLSAKWSSSTTTATTFTAAASPGGQQCVTTATSCTITGLANNQAYTVTVTGANYAGSASLTGTATPNGAPQVPATIRTTPGMSRVTFRWSQLADSVGVTYRLASRDNRYSCVTTGTSCVVRRLPNGKAVRLYMQTTTAAGGTSLGTTSVKVWAGFNVRRTEVKRSTRISLTKLVTPVSKGRRSWRTTSQCRISAGRLITPRRKATCYVTLRVAKTRTTPATSIRLKIAVR